MVLLRVKMTEHHWRQQNQRGAAAKPPVTTAMARHKARGGSPPTPTNTLIIHVDGGRQIQPAPHLSGGFC